MTKKYKTTRPNVQIWLTSAYSIRRKESLLFHTKHTIAMKMRWARIQLKVFFFFCLAFFSGEGRVRTFFITWVRTFFNSPVLFYQIFLPCIFSSSGVFMYKGCGYFFKVSFLYGKLWVEFCQRNRSLINPKIILRGVSKAVFSHSFLFFSFSFSLSFAGEIYQNLHWSCSFAFPFSTLFSFILLHIFIPFHFESLISFLW